MKAYDDMAVLQDLQVELDPVVSRYALLVNDPRLAFTGDKLKVDATLIQSDIAGESIDAYDEITNKVFAAFHTIVSYTVPALKVFNLRHVSVSGTNRASYRVLYDAGVIVAKKRTWYTNYNEDFFFEADGTLGLKFTAGQVIYVDVTHFRSDVTGDFNATISGRLEDA
jgi:hypothetical protein